MSWLLAAAVRPALLACTHAGPLCSACTIMAAQLLPPRLCRAGSPAHVHRSFAAPEHLQAALQLPHELLQGRLTQTHALQLCIAHIWLRCRDCVIGAHASCTNQPENLNAVLQACCRRQWPAQRVTRACGSSLSRRGRRRLRPAPVPSCGCGQESAALHVVASQLQLSRDQRSIHMARHSKQICLVAGPATTQEKHSWGQFILSPMHVANI